MGKTEAKKAIIVVAATALMYGSGCVGYELRGVVDYAYHLRKKEPQVSTPIIKPSPSVIWVNDRIVLRT